MVNVASEWGLTQREYTQLQQLYDEFKGVTQTVVVTNSTDSRYYSDRGLRIIAFPSNEFGGQEPDSNSVIFERVKSEYSVSFDMMAKTEVNGDNPEPLWNWMKNHKNGSGFLFNNIKWNFTKFLIDRNGQVFDRYAPSTHAITLRDDILKLL